MAQPMLASLLLPVVLVLFGVSFVANNDLSFPLSLIDGTNSDEQILAAVIDSGSIAREIAIPIFGLFGIYLIARPSARRLKLVLPIGLLLVAYVSWAVISIFWSEEPGLTLRRLSVFLICLVGILGLVTLELRLLRTAIIWTILATFTVGLMNELLLGTFHPFTADYRFSGTVHPNRQAMMMAQLALTGLCCALDPSIRRVWIGMSLFALGTATVIMTQSRTALICLIIASALTGLIWSWRRTASAMLVVVCLAGAGGLVVMLAEAMSPETSPTAAAISAFEKPRDEGTIESLTGRTDLWETCIEIGKERLLTGVGFDSFWTPERILKISQIQGWAIEEAHSVYIENFVTLGMVGFVLWCLFTVGALITAVWRYAVRQSASYLWLAAQIAFCIANGFSEYTSYISLAGVIPLMAMVHLSVCRDGDAACTSA